MGASPMAEKVLEFKPMLSAFCLTAGLQAYGPLKQTTLSTTTLIRGWGGGFQWVKVLGIYSYIYITVIPILMSMLPLKLQCLFIVFLQWNLFARPFNGYMLQEIVFLKHFLLQFLAHLCRRKSKFHDSHLKGSKFWGFGVNLKSM